MISSSFVYFNSWSFSEPGMEFVQNVKSWVEKNILQDNDLQNFKLKIKANPHDFGTYYSLDIYVKEYFDTMDCIDNEDEVFELNDPIILRANEIDDLILKQYENYL